MKNDQSIKPPVKWVGGKTQFKEQILELMPKKSEINNYIEPFLGGGSIFFELKPKKAIINDLNYELISLFKLLQKEGKRERERERERLDKVLDRYLKNDSKEFYEKIRNQDPLKLDELKRCARFVYLNKTGFNGMYRVNKSGKFNIPYRGNGNKSLYDANNLDKIRSYLSKEKIEIYNESYEKILEKAKKGDFVFVDPPYHNVFSSYTKEGFDENDQINLFNELDKLTKKGVKWILCNNPSPFILNLYKKYKQKYIFGTRRSINSKGDERSGKDKEVFILNYNPKNIKDRNKYIEYVNFEKTLKLTNRSLESLVDWDKVKKNIIEQEFNLNILNNFIGLKTNDQIKNMIEKVFEKRNEECFESLNILVAKRDASSEEFLKEEKIISYDLSDKKDVFSFIIDSNLKSLFKNVKDLKDYVFGVEVGLDSHGRKNRTGSIMENIIEGILSENKITPGKQVKEEWTNKIFDFVFIKNNKKYYVETNFFNGGGSKISEILKSYVDLTLTSKENKKNFIWITDGKGIKTIKKQMIEKWDKVNVMNSSQFKSFLKE